MGCAGSTKLRAVATKRLTRITLDLVLTPDVGTRRRPAGRLPAAGRAQARHHPAPGDRGGPGVPGHGGLPRDAGADPARPAQPVASDHGRGPRRRGAGDLRLVVRVQRPPARQGDVRHHGAGAEGPAGDQQRRAGVPARHPPEQRVAVADGEPMATYLAFFAAGRFRVQRGTANGLPFTYAVSKGLPPAQRRGVVRMLRRTPQVVDWLAGQFGPYPFRATGGVVRGSTSASRSRTRPGRCTRTSATAGRALDRGARARAPVVRRLGVGAQLARHLAQRGLRVVRRVAYDAAHGGSRSRARLPEQYDAVPATSRSGGCGSATRGRSTCSRPRCTSGAR